MHENLRRLLEGNGSSGKTENLTIRTTEEFRAMMDCLVALVDEKSTDLIHAAIYYALPQLLVHPEMVIAVAKLIQGQSKKMISDAYRRRQQDNCPT